MVCEDNSAVLIPPMVTSALANPFASIRKERPSLQLAFRLIELPIRNVGQLGFERQLIGKSLGKAFGQRPPKQSPKRSAGLLALRSQQPAFRQVGQEIDHYRFAMPPIG